MKSVSGDAALVLIDIQVGLDDPALGERNNPQAEMNAAKLLASWRRLQLPLFHVQHLSRSPNSPLHPDKAGVAIKAVVEPLPDEPLITKDVNNAFVGTDLESRLRRLGITCVVVAGLTTDHCVSTTARMASDLGFRTFVVGDATATHERIGPDGRRHGAEDMHISALASLHGEFATIVSTDWMLNQYAPSVPHASLL